MEINNHLSEGISALKAGNREAARRSLAQALRADPNSERTWQWMFNAANNDTERKKCLNEILRINPENQKAVQMYLDLQKNSARPVAGTGMSDDEFVNNLREWSNGSLEWPEMDKQVAIGEIYKKETENFEILIEKTKKCPYCAETILQKADICKHCGKNINSTQILGQQLGTIGKSMQSVGCLLTILVSIPACLCIAFLLLGQQ